MRKLFLTCCLSVVALQLLQAQDPHYSQFFSSPLTINPALTGKFYGDYRLTGNYRNQWPSIANAFTTVSASADFHLMQNRLPSNDAFGIGFMAYNDKSANGAVNFNYFGASLAYHKGLDEDGNNTLGGGFQVTYANMLINTAGLTFEDQLTSSGFTGVTSEVFNNASLKTNYLDVNAGVLYNGSTSDRNNFYLGASIYHINRPKQSFTGADYVLNPRTTIHGGGYFPLSDAATLHISAMQTFQGGASETLLGGAVQLTANPEVPKPTSLYLGSWVRLKDAFIPYLGLEFDDFRLGITYDYNTSALKTASQNRGGIEISLIYIHRPSTDHPISCPKF